MPKKRSRFYPHVLTQVGKTHVKYFSTKGKLDIVCQKNSEEKRWELYKQTPKRAKSLGQFLSKKACLVAAEKIVYR